MGGAIITGSQDHRQSDNSQLESTPHALHSSSGRIVGMHIADSRTIGSAD
jgi:hypothetical protein